MPAYSLDPQSREALYKQLYRNLRADIAAGVLSAGQRLPSKRQLASDLGVSVVTVETALSQLTAEGWVQARARSGYYVSQIEGVSLATGIGAEGRSPERPSGQGRSGKDLPPIVTTSQLPTLPQVYAYDLATSRVSAETFPLKAWMRTVRTVLSQEPEDELIEAGDPLGNPRLRQAISHYLQETRDLRVNPDCIVVGAGAQTLYNLLVQLLGRDRAYAVEDPGYPTLAKVYRANGADVGLMPVSRMGMDFSLLEAGGVGVAHVMPSHQFPTGRVMPASERYDLLAWANEDGRDSRGRYIIEDDYDSELRLQGRPVPALKEMDALGRVIYANTFTRSLAPGLRIAYMVLPSQLMDRYRLDLGFYSCTAPNITQLALARFMEDGALVRHVARVRKASRKVRDALVGELRDGSPRIAEFFGTDAGLHLMMRVEGLTDEEVIRRAAQAGVRLQPLSAYSMRCAQGDRQAKREAQGWFPLSFSALSVDQAHEAGGRLAKSLS